eukprot:jgi/Botrbrau1/17716/Bobra.0166s0138.1
MLGCPLCLPLAELLLLCVISAHAGSAQVQAKDSNPFKFIDGDQILKQHVLEEGNTSRRLLATLQSSHPREPASRTSLRIVRSQSSKVLLQAEPPIQAVLDDKSTVRASLGALKGVSTAAERRRKRLKRTKKGSSAQSIVFKEFPWAFSLEDSGALGPNWVRKHAQHKAAIKELEEAGGVDVILYGDSMVEMWAGTYMGTQWSLFRDQPDVWESFFGHENFTIKAFGFTGDGVGPLMWRLLDGELPKDWSPKVIVLSVGTSDLEGSSCTLKHAKITAGHIQTMIKHILKQLRKVHVIYSAILPKGGHWPNMCSEAITHVNEEMSRFSEKTGRLSLMDLGPIFVFKESGGESKISEGLMPDSMHPSRAGATIMAYQLRRVLRNQLQLEVHEGDDTFMLANPGWANLLRGLPY